MADFVAIMRGLHRMQENRRPGHEQDKYLKSFGIVVGPKTSTVVDIIKPNINKPYFQMNPESKKLVQENKCPNCKNHINLNEFKTELEKSEYSWN